MAEVISLKGVQRAPSKSVRSSTDTLLVTPAEMQAWALPRFQRPLRVNSKVWEIAELMKANGGIMPGVLTVGRLKGSTALYLVDGQHRREAFILSELKECIAEVRVCEFDNMAHMAREFIALNARLVNMRPDDILRASEEDVRSIRYIRESCDFIGFENIRRGDSKRTPLLSMSATLRCWFGSAHETPVAGTAGKAAIDLAEELDMLQAQEMVKFLLTARAAWGSDVEYFRLWGNLNLTVNMWLWRRLVVDQERGVRRYVRLSPDQFRKCLMSLSASPDYLDWLVGRNMGERDRSPCYSRIKGLFASRLRQESRDPTKKPLLPSPAWASK